MKRMFRTVAQTTTLAMAAVVAVGLAPAGATTGPVTYACKVTSPITVTTDATVTYDTNLPDRMYIGDPDFVADLDGKGAVPKGAMDQARQFYSAYYVQGSSQLPFTWNGKTITVTTDTGRRVISETADTPLDKLYEDIVTFPTPTATGTYQVRMAKEYKSTNALYKKDGSLAASPVATCTRSADVLVDSVEVWGKATTTLSMPATTLTVGQTSTVTATIAQTGPAAGGSVEFTIDGTKVTSTVANGKATAAFPAKPEGTYAVSAVYTPTGSMVEAMPIAPLSVSVGRAATTTSVALNPARVVAGKPLSAKVKVASPAGTPDGTVEVALDGQTFTGALVGGEADVTLPSDLALGAHSVTASYTPGTSGAFKPSASEALEFSVREPATPTSTTMVLDRSTAEAGQNVKATVTVASTNGVPAGSVKVQAGARSVSATLVDGKAELVLPSLAVGDYDVQASFTAADSEVFDNSQSTIAPLSITAAANVITTTTSLTLVKSTVRAGVAPQAIVYINTLSTGGLPNGTVEVAVDGRTATGTVVEGVAHVTLPTLAPGTYPVDAVFVPANPGAYADSVSTVRQLTVEAAPSRTELSLDLARASTGEPVTATVEVSGADAAGAPAGQVKVSVNGQDVTADLVGGTATVALPALPVGTHTVGASYLPATGGWLSASASPQSTLVVVAPAAATTTVLSLDRATVGEGQRGRVTATVAASAGLARGTVSFAVDGTITEVPVVNGQASYSLPVLPVGTHQVNAGFAPADDRDFLASGASPVSLTVKAEAPVVAPATITRTTVAAAASATVGGSFTATATVSGAGVAGTVIFSSGWGVVKANVVNGRATGTLRASTVGSQSVQAEFVPADASKFTPSLGSTTVKVVKRVSTTRATAKVVKKKTVALRAKVTPVDQFCGGSVTFVVKRGAATVKKLSAVPTCTGVATTVMALPKKKGTYTVLVTFSGTSTVAGSKKTVTFKR